MSVRSRTGNRPGTAVAKAFTGSGAPPTGQAPVNVPAVMQQAATDVSQMGFEHTFAPGIPIGPYDGYQRHPRQQDFVTGYNIATRPRTNERVSFDTLNGLITSYDVAQMCIYHRIDSIRSLDWQLVAMDGYEGDVTDAITVGKAALKKPDRERTFDNWLSAWLFDVLAYDAGALYRLRNRGGKPIGLLSVDGKTIAPLLDYWGMRPQAPAEAYVQYVQGLPWNWLTQDDMVYQPMRPHNDSPYGHAPIEIVMLNANTDIRFQLYFLQRFTEGNIPEAFAAAPETWTPQIIEQFQEYWDGFMYGDQSRKSQIRWVPGGSSFTWSNEKDFSDSFSLFLMRKTCAAFHVVPSDLGFTENVNRSSGESQADVQHRVGDLPMLNYVEGILDDFLQDDLSLPIALKFDRGEEQVDQVAQAQADKIYVDMGAVSPSHVREIRYGLNEPDGQPVPRYIMTSRGGPVPLASLMAVAGQIDAATGAPAPGSELPHKVFGGTEGVLPNPPIRVMSLAEQEFGAAAMPPAPPPQPKMTPQDVGLPGVTPQATVAKDGEASGGITAATGIYGDPLLAGNRLDENDDEADQADRQSVDAAINKAALVAKSAEVAAFRRYVRGRRRAGTWRDFQFTVVGSLDGHRLNDEGRATVRKGNGELVAAGLAVKAADTGRVLMLQRALSDDDPAGGKLEFPGGHIEDGETPLHAAWREWAEETGCVPPPGVQTGSWNASNGVYAGIVWTVDREASIPVRGDSVVPNPDDPDGDQVEAILWMNPADLPGNPAVRDELQADMGMVMRAICPCACCNGTGEHGNGCECQRCDASGSEAGASGPVPCEGALDLRSECGGEVTVSPEGEYETVCPCGRPVVYDEANGWQHDDGSISHDDGQSVSEMMNAIAKAGDAGPKAGNGRHWPGWDLDLDTADHWAGKVTAAATGVLTASRMRGAAAAYLAANPDQVGTATGKRDRDDTAAVWLAAWLASQGTSLDLSGLAPGIVADGQLIGIASAAALVKGGPAQLGGWQPGDTAKAGDAVSALGVDLDAVEGPTADSVESALSDGITYTIARALAGADGGMAADELGDAMVAAVADGSMASTLVLTQITALTGQSALSYYLTTTTDTLQWVGVPDARICPACLENTVGQPRPAGEPWPSGDTAPPAHPRCRCALVPDWA